MKQQELIEAILEEYDTNRDGVLSRGEFVDLTKYLLGEHGIRVSSEIFDAFDANHDNVISRDELVELIIEYQL